MKPVSNPKASGFKAGPNKLEQHKISVMAAEGKSAKEISLTLKIKVESIENWIPKKKTTKKKTTKSKED